MTLVPENSAPNLETIDLETNKDIEANNHIGELKSTTDAAKMEQEHDSQDAEQVEEEEEEVSEEELKLRRRNRNKKIIIGLFLLAFIIFVIVDSTTTGYLRSGINTALQWIEANPVAGMFVFMLVYFVATVIFVPGSILTLAAGFVFANAFGLGVGLFLGTLAVFIGASAGAIVSFLLGRFLLRDWVKGLAGKYAVFEALDIALAEKGLRIMTLLRLSPIIPFNAVNYIAGVTSISFLNYCIALFAILPGTILYVFLGASAGSLADSANSGDNMTVTIVVIVVGAVFGIFAIVLTSIYARRELNKVVADRAEAEQEANSATEQGSDQEDDIEMQASSSVQNGDEQDQAVSSQVEVVDDA